MLSFLQNRVPAGPLPVCVPCIRFLILETQLVAQFQLYVTFATIEYFSLFLLHPRHVFNDKLCVHLLVL